MSVNKQTMPVPGKGSLNWQGCLNEKAPLIKERPTDWQSGRQADFRGQSKDGSGTARKFKGNTDVGGR